MAITKKDVDYIAHLSRLKVLENEKEEYARQLTNILEHIKRLNKLNTDNIEPTYYAIDMKNVLRDDKVIESIDKKKVFESAPEIEKNGFKVPRII